MANGISGFYQTLVMAANEASATLVFNLEAIESVFLDYRPEATALGQTMNVVIPQVRTGLVVDAGVSDMVLNDVATNVVPIVMNKHPQDALVIRNFEQFNSPQLLRTLFLDSALKAIKESINAAVTALFTSANFNVYTPASATGGIVSVSQFLAQMAVLSDARVPVVDTENMSLILPSTPFTKMMDSSTTAGQAWVQAQIAGQRTAEAVRASGRMPNSFGCTMRLDQQMPVTGAAPTRTFTGFYGHRYSIAVATRPLPAPSDKVVDFFYLDFGGIPILVTLGYNQYPKQGWIVSVEAGYGLKVVRPEMGQLFSIAE